MFKIQLAHPEFMVFVAFGLAMVMIACFIWFKRRERIIAFFGNTPGRIYSRVRVGGHLATFFLIALCIGLLLCEPYIAKEKAVAVFEPLNIVFALDISKSMLAPVAGYSASERSCPPTRLQMAVKEVLGLAAILEGRSIDKVALVVFARFAYPAIAVFTDDFPLFRKRLRKEVQLENVLSMAEGSNHWAAIESSLRIFNRDSPYRKLLIILTDGDPGAPADILAESKAAAFTALQSDQDVMIYVVGLGEPGKSLPIPLQWKPDGCPDPTGGYMVQTVGPDQNRVMSTLTDIGRLQAFAQELGATYLHSETGANLSLLLQDIVAQERKKIDERYETVLIDLTEPLLWVLLFLAGTMLVLKTP